MKSDIDRLRALIAPPVDGYRCDLKDEVLEALLKKYPCFELAAYCACMLLARNDSLAMPDGTQLPSQREYWLSRAAILRPSRTRTQRKGKGS